MHTIAQAAMICDSVSPDGIRLSTIHVRYPRMIHDQVMTHRVFSRNGRSSRAVPTLTLRQEEVYVPFFKTNRPGMQPGEPVSDTLNLEFREEWEHLAKICQQQAASWAKRGMHKQWANRCLEWFGWMDLLISSTDWENFLFLRDHHDAQDEVVSVAEQIRLVMGGSQPRPVAVGDWHLPYIRPSEYEEINSLEIVKRISAARCARISYKPFNGQSDIDSELQRYDNLITSLPPHASPVEHQATPDVKRSTMPGWKNDHLHGNFVGWIQNRKMVPNESVVEKHYEL